jgi:hypothetical protein
MSPCTFAREELALETRDFYRDAQLLLRNSQIPFLVGGTFAVAFYTGISRCPRDLDLFVRPEDWPRIRDAFSTAGYQAELTFPHWLGKVFAGDCFIDIIFSSGNGVAKVDEEWFLHGVAGEVLDLSVQICPSEELIWTKAYVMERERYDGGDVAHLLRARAPFLDWSRLLRRFGPHWEVLLSHLILFGFAYPRRRSSVPEWVFRELIGRLNKRELVSGSGPELCQGTLLSREQYLTDIQSWGDLDARLLPPGSMSPRDIAQWTEAIYETKTLTG